MTCCYDYNYNFLRIKGSHQSYCKVIKLLQPGQRNGEGSSAQNSSAQKNCSTPKSRLLDTVRADDKNI